MSETFGGLHTRPDRSGVGRSQRELRDRASFDQAPAAGASCLLILALPIAGLVLVAALISTTGVIA
ncbi:hypothetical protein [Streptomyces sp. Wh19]|uniref:hypothetical protein n=1 Tax=Streptomyces sp. Wh19 TaxID=3076629 RepID=UPI0029588A53|nr:hypothetical protein [Streptomyces sp. Wh19]MDV9194349.1 hypothetical protein [Streptomyces sp. Wh19]